MSSDEAFDLPAAALRADRAELDSSIDLLASTLEQALPRFASVERRKVGGFRSRRTEVRRIVVTLGDERFELVTADRAMQCTRNKVVRGITLSHDELATSEWIAALLAAVSRTAELTERDRAALEGVLR
ncbi:MAG TPA: hypothetical protein VN889_00560 [Solirubrobacteraceae bacterium]|nr:hypothetical protein [Solirubrobacteraceae bacterium]